MRTAEQSAEENELGSSKPAPGPNEASNKEILPERAGESSSGSKQVQVLAGSADLQLIERGWKAIERHEYGKARQDFVDAMALSPENGWAAYGLAYVADKQGDLHTALPAYCKALSAGKTDIDLLREVEGRLRAHEHTCPQAPEQD